jgi:hypothetical protein
MSDKIVERPRFYCEKIDAYAKVKAVYTTPCPDSNQKVLVKASCDDNTLCPISEREGNFIHPNYDKCLFYLHLKKLGIAK